MSQQYTDLGRKLVAEGKWVYNERTGKRCLTLIDETLEFNVGKGEFPLVTTRKSFWKAAVAELLGYIRGYDNADDFRKLGAKTWDANANQNEAWLNNPNRTGEDDMGIVYGAIGNHYPVLSWEEDKDSSGEEFKLAVIDFIDTLEKAYDDLKVGKDDRGEIWSFWNPGMFNLGCLRPCVYEHQFSVLDGTLYLSSTQRSCDVPLGLNFNMVQVYFLLAVMAKVTGLKPGVAKLRIVNAHIYEDQLELFKMEIERPVLLSAKFSIDPSISTLDDLRTWVTTDHFEVHDYEHHPAIKYPFSV